MIIQYLKAVDAMSPKMPVGLTSPYQQLLEHGMSFTPSPLVGFRRMKIRECFRNSAMTSMEHGLIYCEGFAVPTGVGIPIHHAWVVNPDGVVIDRTWEAGTAYFGIPFDDRYMMEAMLSSGSWGSMLNHLYHQFLEHTAADFIYKGSINHASSSEEGQPYQASPLNFTGGGFAI